MVQVIGYLLGKGLNKEACYYRNDARMDLHGASAFLMVCLSTGLPIRTSVFSG